MAIDIGGTKTLMTCFEDDGQPGASQRFATNQDYNGFLGDLATAYAALGSPSVVAAGVAAPGRINRAEGVGVSFGNLAWSNVPLGHDVGQLLNCPVYLDNDANLAGLSEARLVINEFKRVLYVTISTGIGSGFVVNGVIDQDMQDAEGGKQVVLREGHLVTWESFASGKAIVKRFGAPASQINDPAIWQQISQDFASGLLSLNAVLQPEVIVLGGGVSTHFNKFGDMVLTEMVKFNTPMTPTPVLRPAQRPEEAVVYGCFELAKDLHGKTPATS